MAKAITTLIVITAKMLYNSIQTKRSKTAHKSLHVWSTRLSLRMLKPSIIGVFLLLTTIALLCYQVIAGALAMGTSNAFAYRNIKLIEILNQKFLNGISRSISSVHIQGAIDFIITTPLIYLLFVASIIFFILHAFTKVK